jgi:hypothetical protein
MGLGDTLRELGFERDVDMALGESPERLEGEAERAVGVAGDNPGCEVDPEEGE